jgi:predicted HicB family RNase H-like nuclease
MADRYRAAPLSVRLSQEDHQWLAKSAQQQDVSVRDLVERAVQHFRYWQGEGQRTFKEALEIFEAEHGNLDDERRHRQDLQRQHQLQSRRLHDMLRDERSRRIECEKHRRGERGDYERQAGASAAHGDAPYDPTVAKLLALAIYSESDSEAMAAFAKARSLHHQER